MNSHADYSNRRQIVVFATANSSSLAVTQRSVETLHCLLVERDTDVRFVDIAELSDTLDSSPDGKREGQGGLAELSRLRGQEQLEFEMVLVGKDGGVKARTDDPTALRDFLSLIDTMPMRRAEMRSQDDDRCD